jgi:hypothetical protein
MNEQTDSADKSPTPLTTNPVTLNPASTPAPAHFDASGEFDGGNRRGQSGINQAQNRAVGQDDPIAEGSRQGRERYRSSPAESEAERKEIPPV